MNDQEKDSQVGFTMYKVDVLQNLPLVQHLQEQGIPFAFARKYLKEVTFHNPSTGKDFIVIGMCNIHVGYEVISDGFNGCIWPRAISFVRGSSSDDIHVFENFMDFLSLLSSRKQGWLAGDAVILHSTVCLSQAVPYLLQDNYKTVYTWMNNTSEGIKSTLDLYNFIQAKEGLLHKSMNLSFAPYKDVSTCHRHKNVNP